MKYFAVMLYGWLLIVLIFVGIIASIQCFQGVGRIVGLIAVLVLQLAGLYVFRCKVCGETVFNFAPGGRGWAFLGIPVKTCKKCGNKNLWTRE